MDGAQACAAAGCRAPADREEVQGAGGAGSGFVVSGLRQDYSQRFWELTAIAHGILADLEEAIAGKTGLWAKLRHREEEARKGQPMKRGSPRTKASRPTVDLSGGAPAGQPPPAVECLTCGKVAPRAAMKVCSRCKSAYFCGAECQKAGWKRHKPACVARASPNAAVVEPRGRQTMVQSAVFDVG